MSIMTVWNPFYTHTCTRARTRAQTKWCNGNSWRFMEVYDVFIKSNVRFTAISTPFLFIWLLPDPWGSNGNDSQEDRRSQGRRI